MTRAQGIHSTTEPPPQASLDLFILEKERERERERERGSAGGEGESQADCAPNAKPNRGLIPHPESMTSAKTKSWVLTWLCPEGGTLEQLLETQAAELGCRICDLAQLPTRVSDLGQVTPSFCPCLQNPGTASWRCLEEKERVLSRALEHW